MIEWPPYQYKAQKTNPYSLMSREGDRLFFVTCAETLEEIQGTMNWLRAIPPQTGLKIYRDGNPTDTVHS